MRGRGWFALVAGLSFAPAAHAHPLAPSVLSFEGSDGDRVELVWRSPRQRPVGERLAPRVPSGCRLDGAARRTVHVAEIVERWPLRCTPSDLSAIELGVDGLEDSRLSVVVRWVPRNGPTETRLLDAAEPTVVFSAAEASGSFPAYLRLGVEHLLTGWDHVAFVIGLVLLIGWRRRLIAAVTAFTVGHSITLAAAVLGVVRAPAAIVEILIAASLMVLALEIHQDRAGFVARHPWSLPGSLGLLHGLGFASVLRDAGIPRDEIPLALFGFNLGVELGQLVLVAAVGVGALVLRATAVRTPRRSAPIWANALGGLAAFWILERTLDALAS